MMQDSTRMVGRKNGHLSASERGQVTVTECFLLSKFFWILYNCSSPIVGNVLWMQQQCVSFLQNLQNLCSVNRLEDLNWRTSRLAPHFCRTNESASSFKNKMLQLRIFAKTWHVLIFTHLHSFVQQERLLEQNNYICFSFFKCSFVMEN